MRKAKYICFEGTEGCGKTTQVANLANHLTSCGYKVLVTKEPGTPHAPITMQLRGIMLDVAYKDMLTTSARELINQAIRSVHIEKVIMPALKEYDYIIQDRGILSGFSYGLASGNSLEFLNQLNDQVLAPLSICTSEAHPISSCSLYDMVVYLHGNTKSGLLRAQNTKQEFASGDIMESRPLSFMEEVSSNMNKMVEAFPRCIINVEDKTVQENFNEILRQLKTRSLI